MIFCLLYYDFALLKNCEKKKKIKANICIIQNRRKVISYQLIIYYCILFVFFCFKKKLYLMRKEDRNRNNNNVRYDQRKEF